MHVKRALALLKGQRHSILKGKALVREFSRHVNAVNVIHSDLLEAAFTGKMASDSTGGASGPIIIDGKATAETIRQELKGRVSLLSQQFGRVSCSSG